MRQHGAHKHKFFGNEFSFAELERIIEIVTLSLHAPSKLQIRYLVAMLRRYAKHHFFPENVLKQHSNHSFIAEAVLNKARPSYRHAISISLKATKELTSTLKLNVLSLCQPWLRPTSSR